MKNKEALCVPQDLLKLARSVTWYSVPLFLNNGDNSSIIFPTACRNPVQGTNKSHANTRYNVLAQMHQSNVSF